MFWPDNTNPTSTLQNNISRLRAALADMGFTDTKQLVRCEGGFYRWSSEPATVWTLMCLKVGLSGSYFCPHKQADEVGVSAIQGNIQL